MEPVEPGSLFQLERQRVGAKALEDLVKCVAAFDAVTSLTRFFLS